MIKSFGEFLTRHPRTIVCSVMLAALLVATGAARLQFVPDYRAFFDQNNKDYQQLQHLEAQFGATDDLLLGYKPASGDATTPQAMAVVAELADGLREMPFAGRVSSVAGLTVAVNTPEGPKLTSLRALSSDGPVDPGLWAQAVNEVAKLTTGTLLAPDRSIAAAHVTTATPVPAHYTDTKAVNDYVVALRDRVEAELGDKGTVVLAGVLPYYHMIMELAVRDVGLLVPCVLLFAILILRSLLSSWRATLACATPIVAAVLTTVGAHGWLGYPVTAATMVAPIMVLVISLAYVVHYADTYLHIRPECESAAEAAHKSLAENLLPLSLTTLTTMLGFLTLNFAVSPVYRQMGNSVLVGVLMAAIAATLLMPAMLSWLDPPYWRKKGILSRGLEKLGSVISRPIQSRWIIVTAVLSIVGLLACIPMNTVDDNISNWFKDSTRLRQDNIVVNQRLTGMQQLYYALPAGKQGAAADPAYLAKVDRFAQWLRLQDNVAAVRSLPDVVRALAHNFGTQVGVNGLPHSQALVQQLLWAYSFSAPPDDHVTGLLNDQHSASLVHIAVHNLPGDEFQALDKRAQAWLQQNLPDMQVAPGTSAVMMFSKMAHDNIAPMIVGTLGVLLVAGLVVVIGLRSKRLGLLTVLPALLPVGLAFGVWGLISGHVGIALSVVANAALGIIVDDIIHVLARYRAARKRGMDAQQACAYTVSHVGGALTTTTLVLSVGMGLLSFASIQPTHEMGLMMPLIFIFAWLSTLVLLPQLLTRFDK